MKGSACHWCHLFRSPGSHAGIIVKLFCEQKVQLKGLFALRDLCCSGLTSVGRHCVRVNQLHLRPAMSTSRHRIIHHHTSWLRSSVWSFVFSPLLIIRVGLIGSVSESLRVLLFRESFVSLFLLKIINEKISRKALVVVNVRSGQKTNFTSSEISFIIDMIFWLPIEKTDVSSSILCTMSFSYTIFQLLCVLFSSRVTGSLAMKNVSPYLH